MWEYEGICGKYEEICGKYEGICWKYEEIQISPLLHIDSGTWKYSQLPPPSNTASSLGFILLTVLSVSRL